MQDFPDVDTTQEEIKEIVSYLKSVKYMIDELESDKQQSEAKLRELLQHPEIDGSKTYKSDGVVIKVTTGLNHVLDKKRYDDLKMMINPKFDPVKEITKYELNKKTLRNCIEFGTQEDKYLQSQFIISKPKKLHISIESKNDEKDNSSVADACDPVVCADAVN